MLKVRPFSSVFGLQPDRFNKLLDSIPACFGSTNFREFDLSEPDDPIKVMFIHCDGGVLVCAIAIAFASKMGTFSLEEATGKDRLKLLLRVETLLDAKFPRHGRFPEWVRFNRYIDAMKDTLQGKVVKSTVIKGYEIVVPD
jgi:hypothetical protein